MENPILALLVVLQIEFIAVVGWLIVTKRLHAYKKSHAVLLDTSVLIDGRITAAVESGFVPNKLIIPKSVLLELQYLADGSDSDKRTRARHGLDVATSLQESKRTDVTVLNDSSTKLGVDDQLLSLARQRGFSICTIDFNLNKVATAEGIPVLNINELSKQLRMNHLPGDRVSLTIVQKGNDARQGVGYFSDGTMVVVEQAQADIGKLVEIEVIRSLQTAAGKMIFAKKTEQSKQANATTKKPSGQRRIKKTSPEDALIELANS